MIAFRSSWVAALRLYAFVDFAFAIPPLCFPPVRPEIKTPLRSEAAALIERDSKAMSPSFTAAYPFVMERGRALGHRRRRQSLPRFHRRIAVVTTGHSIPSRRRDQRAGRTILHMSAPTSTTAPRSSSPSAWRTESSGTPADIFTNSGAEAIEVR